jgi:hypothetical protein
MTLTPKGSQVRMNVWTAGMNQIRIACNMRFQEDYNDQQVAVQLTDRNGGREGQVIGCPWPRHAGLLRVARSGSLRASLDGHSSINHSQGPQPQSFLQLNLRSGPNACSQPVGPTALLTSVDLSKRAVCTSNTDRSQDVE